MVPIKDAINTRYDYAASRNCHAELIGRGAVGLETRARVAVLISIFADRDFVNSFNFFFFFFRNVRSPRHRNAARINDRMPSIKWRRDRFFFHLLISNGAGPVPQRVVSDTRGGHAC